MVVNRCFVYRLYPNRAQRGSLATMLETHRTVYNDALTERRLAWQMNHKSVNYCAQANQLKAARGFDADLAQLNYSSTQQTLRRLDKAFAAFFRRVKAGETPGFPRYKGRHRFNSFTFVWNDGARLNGQRLKVHGIGAVKVKWHRPFPEGAVVKQVVLQRQAGQRWFAVFMLELPDALPVENTGEAVGLDVGLESFAALSTGELIENPRWYRHAEARLAEAQRRLSRKVKGSANFRQQARWVAKQHEHIAHQRRDFQHKLAHELVHRFGLIAVEKLNVRGLAGGWLAKSVHDAAWGQFLSFLAYKAEKAGCQLVRINPRGTSQTCSGCGDTPAVPKDLSVRIHVCPNPDCGLILNRDVNAACNILQLGLLPTSARTEPSALRPRSRRVYATE